MHFDPKEIQQLNTKYIRMKTFISDLSNSEFPISDRISGRMVRKSILYLIQKKNPEFTSNKYLSVSELNSYQEEYIEEILTKQIGELTSSEKKY